MNIKASCSARLLTVEVAGHLCIRTRCHNNNLFAFFSTIRVVEGFLQLELNTRRLIVSSTIFLKKDASGPRSDPKFVGERGLVILIAGKNFGTTFLVASF
jgi:hypothetical protein